MYSKNAYWLYWKTKPRMEYIKQTMTGIGEDSYEELKELSCSRKTRRTAANQSNGLKRKEEEGWSGTLKKKAQR